MGAWGYRWEQCDDAYDLSANVFDVLRKPWQMVLKRKDPVARSRWYGEARAAAGMAVLLRGFVSEEYLREAAEALRVILQDEAYIESYNEPERFKRALRNDIRRLEYHAKNKRSHWEEILAAHGRAKGGRRPKPRPKPKKERKVKVRSRRS